MTRPSGRRPSAHRVVPRPKWLVIGLVFGAFCCLLLADGLVRPTLGADVRGAATPQARSAGLPESILEGGSVIDATADKVRSLPVPDKTVAVTFDDGPDPQWTPQVLEVLRQHQVPGTFFCSGRTPPSTPR